MKIRPYRTHDLEAVVDCFNRSVRVIGARYYSPVQIDAWAPETPDWQAWRRRLESGGVFVAECGGELAGFVRVEQNGLVDLLYVEPAHERQGVARQLVQAAASWGIRHGAYRLRAEVSIAARPFFEAIGFRVEAEQRVERRGVTLCNFRMVREHNGEAGV